MWGGTLGVCVTTLLFGLESEELVQLKSIHSAQSALKCRQAGTGSSLMTLRPSHNKAGRVCMWVCECVWAFVCTVYVGAAKIKSLIT